MKENTILTYLFLCFINLPLQAQIDYTQSYYPYINKAELSIVAKDYVSAKKIYETAFEKVDYQLTLDIYNYSCVLAYLKEDYLLKKYLSILVQRGYYSQELKEIIYLLDNEAIQSSISSYLTQHEDSLMTYYKPSEFILRQVQEIAQQEEKINQGTGASFIAEQNEGFYKFIKLVKSIGFPDDRIIGREASTINQPVEEFCKFYIYNNGGKDLAIALTDTMLQAVKDGKLSPDFFSRVADFSTDFSIYGTNLLYRNKEKQLFITYRAADEELIIDENRKKLGIGTLAEARLKKKYFCNQAEIPPFKVEVCIKIPIFVISDYDIKSGVKFIAYP